MSLIVLTNSIWFEKFQSIGVGDPRRRWLVDSGATCHIIAERWLSNYKIVYRYEVGIPVLKGAGDNVLPTRGMVIWSAR